MCGRVIWQITSKAFVKERHLKIYSFTFALARCITRRRNVPNGWLIFRQFKGREWHLFGLEIPIIPELQKIIDANATGNASIRSECTAAPPDGE